VSQLYGRYCARSRLLATVRRLLAAALLVLGCAGVHAAPLELIVLGSGGPAALGRASSSYLLLIGGEPRILVDAGSGSFTRLGEAHVSLDRLDTILLTHLHVDHAAELPGIIKARAVAAGQPIQFSVFGPTGRSRDANGAAFPSTTRFMTLLFGSAGAFAYLKDFAAPVSFAVQDLAAARGNFEPQVVQDRAGLKISAVGGHHGDAPAIIYRIDYQGRSVVFSGDIDARGLPALERIARGADLLIFHAVVLDPPGSPQILYTLHTPPEALGKLAGECQVRAVLLSHLSPAVEAQESAVTRSIRTHYQGPLTFATDGLRVQP
jgi:ribonuclease BN (tRNA processing enzyme)